ncbi:DUF6221 family protein [Streptomyces sp. ME02-7008A-1]|uniref:DUF6221 family protein n=1 Tax=unclassified Streptomyces TaxID=2593676 RepID=UPI0029ADF68A|nr:MULTISPECIES: DUF6221 family protein [unclassified Streptomyces]MDX3183515.1 DUF6221 family protein [Streptomyces sp. ME02-7008A-1]MDX3303967.1 DUF6221 family protein [Streptomyces sp. ME02-7008A]
MTDALAAFLKARLDEDEQTATAPSSAVWASPEWRFTDGDDGPFVDLGTNQLAEGSGLNAAELEHIARQDPARTLREVEAKRGLLDAALTDRHHVSADQYETCPRATAADGLDETTLAALEDLNEERRQEDGVEPKCWDSCGRDARVRRTLELLALPHSDHPEYEEALTADQA